MADLTQLQKKAKLRLLQMHYEAGVGHIGGNLSCLDAMLCLFNNFVTKDDKFILSKGHSAGALYIALWSIGVISNEQLKTFHQDGTKLAGHPAPNWMEEIPFATGSLGHGLGLSCGIATASKMQGANNHVYCLTSDGEWQEGSNWEALIYANHQKLSNLTIIIDCNNLQGFGSTTEIASLNENRLQKIFSQFDFEIFTIDGHNLSEINGALQIKSSKPKVIIMKTIKGNGISFMQNEMKWHYLPMTQEQYKIAIQEIS